MITAPVWDETVGGIFVIIHLGCLVSVCKLRCPYIFLCTITLCVVLISGAPHIANHPEMLCVRMQCIDGSIG